MIHAVSVLVCDTYMDLPILRCLFLTMFAHSEFKLKTHFPSAQMPPQHQAGKVIKVP